MSGIWVTTFFFLPENFMCNHWCALLGNHLGSAGAFISLPYHQPVEVPSERSLPLRASNPQLMILTFSPLAFALGAPFIL